jgi:2-polyprenyl-6-methoxyphenol hydroxylase-like FAD-dependent oxidoreductase
MPASPANTQPTALVIGGGIGGMCAALALKRAGIDVHVFEAAREFKAMGVGINLQPHAVLVLHDLGLQDALEAVAIQTAELIYVNKFGQRIMQEPRGMAAGYPLPQYSIHRGELHMALYRAVVAALGEDHVHAGHVLAGFEQDAQGVSAHFTDRDGQTLASARGSFMIAADGIHSVVRQQFYPDQGPPVFGNRILWRATTEAEPFLSGRSMVWAGHRDLKFVAYPISAEAMQRGRSLVNWIAELRVPLDYTPPRSDWNKRVDKSVFRESFASWNFGWLNVPDLIDRASDIYEFPLVDRDPVPHWTFGRVTLLGDAAHAMYPIGSNGASQAILDARNIADQFIQAGPRTDNIEACLKQYEAERLPPTAAIVRANRGNGPDQVLELAEERAPNGFAHIHDVVSQQELDDIANRYKQTAGFDKATVERLAAERRARAASAQ